MRSRFHRVETLFRWVPYCLGFMIVGCGAETTPTPPADRSQSHTTAWFHDATRDSGLEFVHRHGGTGERYMIETMGSGGGFGDFDNDGRLDVYLIQSGPVDLTGAPGAANRLYRNVTTEDGAPLRFEDVTMTSGAGDRGYGMGTCFGDVDNDGLLDIYVTNFGADRLLRNAGAFQFEDITKAAGIDNPSWGTSCAFADYDQDGCLDLYVVNYVDFTFDNHRRCGVADLAMYCHPDVYDGVPDKLFRNQCSADGAARFEEVGARAGVRNESRTESKGLGVLWTDYDNDNDVDLYVSNDSTLNFLYSNKGDGTFEDVGVTAGVAFNDAGLTEAGMGVTAGDIDGNGWVDFVVTNLDFETNTLYRNQGNGLFLDATTLTGLAGPSTTKVGFGINLGDFDHDGDLDLFVGNGHILDNVAEQNPTLSYAQVDQLFENRAGRFALVVADQAGPHFDEPTVTRGSALGDVDNDGDLDILITQCDRPARLLLNDGAADGHWLQLKLLSRHGGRDAVGARVEVVVNDKSLLREVRGGTSYLSQGDSRLHVGLGKANSVKRLQIRWPNGQEQIIPGTQLQINALNLLHQPGE